MSSYYIHVHMHVHIHMQPEGREDNFWNDWSVNYLDLAHAFTDVLIHMS